MLDIQDFYGTIFFIFFVCWIKFGFCISLGTIDCTLTGKTFFERHCRCKDKSDTDPVQCIYTWYNGVVNLSGASKKGERYSRHNWCLQDIRWRFQIWIWLELEPPQPCWKGMAWRILKKSSLFPWSINALKLFYSSSNWLAKIWLMSCDFTKIVAG